MATGDNVLTAISVGRECNIIEGEAEVFLGDVRKVGDKEEICWKSTKSSKHEISPNTLIPNQQFFSDMKKVPGHSGFVEPIIEVSKEDDEDSVNDIVSLDDFPWQHPPDLYAIAITGKAFNMLLNDPNATPILN